MESNAVKYPIQNSVSLVVKGSDIKQRPKAVIRLFNFLIKKERKKFGLNDDGYKINEIQIGQNGGDFIKNNTTLVYYFIQNINEL